MSVSVWMTFESQMFRVRKQGWFESFSVHWVETIFIFGEAAGGALCKYSTIYCNFFFPSQRTHEQDTLDRWWQIVFLLFQILHDKKDISRMSELFPCSKFVVSLRKGKDHQLLPSHNSAYIQGKSAVRINLVTLAGPLGSLRLGTFMINFLAFFFSISTIFIR